MARKPRTRPEHETKTIEIERNVIERFLMAAKELVRKEKNIVLYSVIGVAVACVVAIGIIVAVDIVNTRNDKRFEKIMDDYNAF